MEEAEVELTTWISALRPLCPLGKLPVKQLLVSCRFAVTDGAAKATVITKESNKLTFLEHLPSQDQVAELQLVVSSF
jgi:hypothetical protein